MRRVGNRTHRWDLSPAEARALQIGLAAEVIREDAFGMPRRIAGIDIGFRDQGRITRAAVVVLDGESLEPLETAQADLPTRFPYVPGLLSFREIPAALEALEKLTTAPDLLICDGHGLAHPRRFGLACHLGLLSGIPAIGVGKTRLTGRFEPPPQHRGAWSPLTDKDEIIGAVLRSRAGVHPIFVSIGHRVSLDSALRLVMQCVTRYRLPETTRAAHRLASHDRQPLPAPTERDCEGA